jgi:hypothetical protein
MTTTLPVPQATDLPRDSYLAIGVATCFRRVEGEVEQLTLLEPIPSAYLEIVFQGVPTAYSAVYGMTLGNILANGEPQRDGSLPADAVFCADFRDRAVAAARTYQQHASAAANLPVGTRRDDIHYSTEKKRVLNQENAVSPEDNVKQHSYTHQVL